MLCIGRLASPDVGKQPTEAPDKPEAAAEGQPSETHESNPARSDVPEAPRETVKVQKFRFSGNVSIHTAELEKLAEPHLGTEFDLAGSEKIAKAMTEEYRCRGFTLATAYVLEQEVKEETVEIAIVEGQVGEILVEGNKRFSAEFIRLHLDDLLGVGAFREDKLERAVLILNDFPGLKVETTLQAGKEPGTTDIVAKVEGTLPPQSNAQLQQFRLEIRVPQSIQRKSRMGPRLCRGRAVVAQRCRGRRPRQMTNYRLNYLFPLDSAGTKLGVHGYYGDSMLGLELLDLGITSLTRGCGFFAQNWPVGQDRL